MNYLRDLFFGTSSSYEGGSLPPLPDSMWEEMPRPIYAEEAAVPALAENTAVPAFAEDTTIPALAGRVEVVEHKKWWVDERLKEFLPPNGKILVTTQSIGGYGDLAAAAQYVKDLVNRGGISEGQIVCFYNSEHHAKIWKEVFLKETSVPVVTAYCTDAVVLQVAIPIIGAVDYLDLSSIPTIAMGEYNAGIYPFDKRSPLQVASLGLPDRAYDTTVYPIGLMFDVDLVEWGRNQGSLEERREVLASIDESVLKTVLGDKHPSELEKSFSLYLGYANKEDSKACFVTSILSTRKETDKEVIFLLPGDSFDLNTLRLNRLRENGVRKTTSLSRTGEKFGYLNETGYDVRIVSLKLSQSDFRSFLKASDKRVLTTGDQSISQAIALRKEWVYEVRGHKEAFGRALKSYGATSVFCEHAINSDRVSSFFQEVDSTKFLELNESLLKMDYFSASVDLAIKALTR